jgi:mutator protein MutT
MLDKKLVIAGIKALILKDNKFLMVQDAHDLKWEFPGGKVNYGETPFDTLSREIKEEIGIEVEIFEPVGFCWSITEKRQIIMTVIKCKPKSLDFDTKKNLGNEDISQVRFFTKKEFLKDEYITAHHNVKELISSLDI